MIDASEWDKIPLGHLSGVVMIVGAPDTGKTSLARHLFTQLHEQGRRVAYLDGDLGQSTLGPPATITLAMAGEGETGFPPRGRVWRRFVGSTSPRGHMLPLVVGAARLVAAARAASANVILYDTTGLVDPRQGGLSLKLAKIELLEPATVLAIQRDHELEPLLVPLRRSLRSRLIELSPSPAIRSRGQEARQAHRAAQFAAYFRSAHRLTLPYDQLAVYPGPDFAFGQLVALEDAGGFTLDLGIVQQANATIGQVTLITSAKNIAEIAAIRLGSMVVEPRSGRDRQVAL